MSDPIDWPEINSIQQILSSKMDSYRDPYTGSLEGIRDDVSHLKDKVLALASILVAYKVVSIDDIEQIL